MGITTVVGFTQLKQLRINPLVKTLPTQARGPTKAPQGFLFLLKEQMKNEKVSVLYLCFNLISSN